MTAPFATTGPGPLDPRTLMDTARAETGLADFGDEAEFRPALEGLLEALREQAALNDAGHQAAWSRTLAALKNRLWSVSCHRAHPEIAAQPGAAPVLVVGAPHSGAARLHRLLACDTRLAHLRTWEALNPAPRVLPAWPPHAPDVEARRLEAQALLSTRRLRHPQADALQPLAVDGPAPETLLLDQLFCGLTALELHDIAPWWRAFAQADRGKAWQALARLLRLVAWSRGDEPGRRWLLGGPQLALDLPAVLATFPDAKLVFVHRDPLASVTDTLATACHFAAPQTDRDVRASVVGTWLDVCETSARRCIAARAPLAPAQALDLDDAEIDQDWRAAVARVQAFAGLAPDADATAAMARWKALEPPAPAAAPVQDFGLDEAAVAARFAFVREQPALRRG